MIESFLDLLVEFSLNLQLRYKEFKERNKPYDHAIWNYLPIVKIHQLNKKVPTLSLRLEQGLSVYTSPRRIKVKEMNASALSFKSRRDVLEM